MHNHNKLHSHCNKPSLGFTFKATTCKTNRNLICIVIERNVKISYFKICLKENVEKTIILQRIKNIRDSKKCLSPAIVAVNVKVDGVLIKIHKIFHNLSQCSFYHTFF